MEPKREHIFISYATEQAALCEWLARKLAAAGYRVWCDRLKLLGGEDWPKDIDVAIDKRTLRMLALLSKESMSKPNPKGEWLKAISVGEHLGIDDFLIPLKTEDLEPHRMLWNLQTINYIDFTHSWARGLAQVLKKLESIKALRTFTGGDRMAIETLEPSSTVAIDPEALASNCFDIVQIPRNFQLYRATLGTIPRASLDATRIRWPSWNLSEYEFVSFLHPPQSIKEQYQLEYEGPLDWKQGGELRGTDSRSLVVNLIHRSIESLMNKKGLKYYRASRGRRRWYFPYGLLKNNYLRVQLPSGRRTRIKAAGERTFRGKVYQYHLSPSFSVLTGASRPALLCLRIEIYFRDNSGHALRGHRTITARRKHLCKDWFNREWYYRTLAIAQYLQDDNMKISLGPCGVQQLGISAECHIVESPMSVCDALVDSPDELYSDWNSRYLDAGTDHEGEERK